MAEFESVISELNNEVAAKAKEVRTLRKEKEVIEIQFDKMKGELEAVSEANIESRQRAENLKIELQRVTREFEARLEARDSDAKQAISRLQANVAELKNQIAPSIERATRAEQTIEQQRAEYTKIVSMEREARDALQRERERLAQETRKAQSFADAKKLAEERLNDAEQTISELQARLQSENANQKQNANREKELREKAEKDREQWQATEKSLRKKILDLEQKLSDIQSKHEQSIIALKIDHERALSNSSVLTLREELDKVRASQASAVAEACAQLTSKLQMQNSSREFSWTEERRRLVDQLALLEQDLKDARAAGEAAVERVKIETAAASAAELAELRQALETIEEKHATELGKIKSDFYDKLTAERSAREAIQQRRPISIPIQNSDGPTADSNTESSSLVSSDSKPSSKKPSALTSSLNAANLTFEAPVVIPSAQELAQLETIRQEHKQELQRWQMRFQNEKAELKRNLDNEKEEALEALRLQFRQESAMLLLSFEQQQQSLQKQIARLQIAGVAGAASSTTPTSLAVSRSNSVVSSPSRSQHPSSGSRSRVQAIHGAPALGSFSSSAISSGQDNTPSASLLSSSVADIRQRSISLAQDRNVTLSSIDSIESSLVAGNNTSSGSLSYSTSSSRSKSRRLDDEFDGVAGVAVTGSFRSNDSPFASSSSFASNSPSIVTHAHGRAVIFSSPSAAFSPQTSPRLGAAGFVETHNHQGGYRNFFLMIADADLYSEPIFQADESSDTCTLCCKYFGLLLRRHHCRACGHLFCAYCSSKTSRLLWRQNDSQEFRICDVCSLNIRHLTKGTIWK